MNFWELSDGKGAPDSIIRKADKLISLGHDIPDAAHLCMALIPETSTKLFFVEADEVEEAAVLRTYQQCKEP